ncbi:MAG: hypothetical protein K9J37_07585 [Saprospiraceae bacterium]|nr:hypothetical protein [Saprospiraceae bacterium]MCF8249758.1 hypothetical protein [Saprospiraceae bacterium]MCF8279243.1 hypothetical protein [Bacteroidales bacterium]MCF8312791.1 hypothetical protein [Saprospiraceae bacterium]MCF8441238.1 hypothetical protein [Saprospiraceae bacterium]
MTFTWPSATILVFVKKTALAALLLAALHLPVGLWAIDTLAIGPGFERAEGQDFGHVFLEKIHELDFEKIRQLSDSAFLPLAETGISFPPSQEVYWVKFHLRNDSPEARDLLLELHNPRINQLQFFMVDEVGIVTQSSLMGDDFPFRQRDNLHRNFLYPIELAAGGRATIFLFADKYSENMLMRMYLLDREYFNETDRTETFLLAVYAGILASISLFAMVLALMARRHLLTYFAIYCLFATLLLVSWMGFGFRYLWPGWPGFNSTCGYLFTIIICLAIMAFARTFLDTRKILPKTDRVLQVLQWLIAAFFPYLIFYRQFAHSVNHVMANLGHLVELAFVLGIVVAAFLAYRKTGNSDHLLFLGGFLFALLATMVYLLEMLGLTDSNFITQYGILFGFLVDMMVLMFLLGKEMRRTFLENHTLARSLSELKVEAANALVAGQQEERHRLSMELHDGVSLRLASIRMRLSKFVEKGNYPVPALKLITLSEDVRKVSTDIRNFTHSLAPIDFEETTLAEALEDVIYDVEAGDSGLEVTFTYDAGEENLKGFAAHAVYQSAKELLANVLKHADATKVTVGLTIENGNFKFSVADDGKGFQKDATIKGIGLRNLGARATLLNGKMDIISAETGSVVSLIFPQKAME